MKKLSYITSILATKAIIRLIKLSKSGAGTNLPGRIARKISPEILSYLVKQTKKEILVVTGTNGKTTTSGFIGAILESDNRKTVHNKFGANMLAGITTAVVNDSKISGVLDADNCLFEMDEAYFAKAAEEFTPDMVLVTNLFRDQLDRYGELNTTAKKIEQAIQTAAKTKIPRIILNADDPMVASLAEDFSQNKVYFGLNSVKFINQDEAVASPQEAINCKCGKKFQYDKVFYGHIGHFYCACGNTRPLPEYFADAVIDVASSTIIIRSEKINEFEIKLNMPGLYNVYNALAAASMALELGIKPEIIKNSIENYHTIFGRAEKLFINGKEVLIQLIKNPIGATEVLRTVKDDSNGRLLIIINDNYADGRDVSWLWDANFELLAKHEKDIIVSGVRASDMAVRLKYAGIKQDNITIIEDIKEALNKAVLNTQTPEKLYILPTYTALLHLQKLKIK